MRMTGTSDPATHHENHGYRSGFPKGPNLNSLLVVRGTVPDKNLETAFSYHNLKLVRRCSAPPPFCAKSSGPLVVDLYRLSLSSAEQFRHVSSLVNFSQA